MASSLSKREEREPNSFKEKTGTNFIPLEVVEYFGSLHQILPQISPLFLIFVHGNLFLVLSSQDGRPHKVSHNRYESHIPSLDAVAKS